MHDNDDMIPYKHDLLFVVGRVHKIRFFSIREDKFKQIFGINPKTNYYHKKPLKLRCGRSSPLVFPISHASIVTLLCSFMESSKLYTRRKPELQKLHISLIRINPKADGF